MFLYHGAGEVPPPEQRQTFMAQFVIIRGTQNSGKTTTAWMVYQYLSPMTDHGSYHIFSVWNGEVRTPAPIPYLLNVREEDGRRDFKAILTILGKKVGITSAGDFAETVEHDVDDFLQRGVDIIICCTRSYNRENSSYRMIEEKYAPNYPIQDFWVTWDADPAKMWEIKQPTALQVVEFVLHTLLNSQVNTNNNSVN